MKAGQALVIMSAMKMETSVAAPCDGVIKHVAVDIKDSVEAGQFSWPFPPQHSRDKQPLHEETAMTLGLVYPESLLLQQH